MTSFTKKEYPKEILNRIAKKANLGGIISITPLTDGEFNSAYRLETGKGRFLLKIAPEKNAEVLTYERDIAETELFVYSLIKNTGIPVPDVIYSDFSKEIIPADWYILSFLTGEPMNKCRLKKDEKNKVMYRLGEITAELHNIECEDFGYRQCGLHDNWFTAYSSMMQNIMQDSKKKNIRIPCEKKIADIIPKAEKILRNVKKPRLTHFDLWAGNIFIDGNKEIEAIIDTERSYFGDPLGDFVNFSFFGLPHGVLIDGYNSRAANPFEKTDETVTRINLMRLYLGLIMHTETNYRNRKTSGMYIFKKVYSNCIIRIALKNIKL
ncbi:MAG: aminoglycoside phosphotransferase family protein [Oscillospiraceae bacterium]|nr:aminoglycoside phosphotransferase family protein [Oscillospiraceae bacterium]